MKRPALVRVLAGGDRGSARPYTGRFWRSPRWRPGTPASGVARLAVEVATTATVIWIAHVARGLGQSIASAAHAPKALWEIPEAHHTGGFQARPREYEQRVVGFFDRALLGKE